MEKEGAKGRKETPKEQKETPKEQRETPKEHKEMGGHEARVLTSYATNAGRKVINLLNVGLRPKTGEIDPSLMTPKEKEREKEKEKEKVDPNPKTQTETNARFVGKPTTQQPIARTKPQYVKDTTKWTVPHQTVRNTTLEFVHSGKQAPVKNRVVFSFTETAPGLSPGPLLLHLTKLPEQTHQHP